MYLTISKLFAVLLFTAGISADVSAIDNEGNNNKSRNLDNIFSGTSDPSGDFRQESILEEADQKQEAYLKEYEEFITAWKSGEVTVTGVEETDSLALVALYEETNGDQWDHNANWLQEPVATWYGVTVNEGNVTELDLNRNNLQGPIPADLGGLV